MENRACYGQTVVCWRSTRPIVNGFMTTVTTGIMPVRTASRQASRQELSTMKRDTEEPGRRGREW
jgi:hypothetical protein